jgi:hypothetical protein
MALRLEEDHPSIVIVGGFDPRVLQPNWFRAQKLLGQEEADQAEVKVLVPQFTDWSTDSLLIQITQDRFLGQAKVESAADALRDLVVGMLQLLDQTLATALGLNRTMHFDVGGEDNWHKVGHRLAPKELWRPYLKGQPGMNSLQIEDRSRVDGLPGKVVITVQPSLKYKHGVFFDVNNEVNNVDGKPGTSFFSETIRDHWSRLLTEALSMAETLLNEAIK